MRISNPAFLGGLRHHLKRSYDSFFTRRAMNQGFKFGRWQVFEDDLPVIRYAVDFECVCGRSERFVQQLSRPDLDQMYGNVDEQIESAADFGMALYRFGSFSEKHLLEDGYSREHVDSILIKGWEFDVMAIRVEEVKGISSPWIWSVGSEPTFSHIKEALENLVRLYSRDLPTYRSDAHTFRWPIAKKIELLWNRMNLSEAEFLDHLDPRLNPTGLYQQRGIYWGYPRYLPIVVNGLRIL